MVYYLSCLYENGEVRLGTFGNTIYKGHAIETKLKKFKDFWYGRKNINGIRVIGVQIEICERTYARPIETKQIIWE